MKKNYLIGLKKNIIYKQYNDGYIKVNEEEPLRSECQHFINVVEKDFKPLTDGIEGLRVLKVLSAATLAQKKIKL